MSNAAPSLTTAGAAWVPPRTGCQMLELPSVNVPARATAWQTWLSTPRTTRSSLFATGEATSAGVLGDAPARYPQELHAPVGSGRCAVQREPGASGALATTYSTPLSTAHAGCPVIRPPAASQVAAQEPLEKLLW